MYKYAINMFQAYQGSWICIRLFETSVVASLSLMHQTPFFHA